MHPTGPDREQLPAEPDPAPWPAPDPDTLAALRSWAITECQLVPWGSNYTFAVRLEQDGQESMIGIYKPASGEIPLWDFESGTLYRREYASYLVSELLGWHFIPPMVIRDGPHGIGTVQLYVEPDTRIHDRELHRRYADELLFVALFDLLTNNADRKASHCFVGRRDRLLWGIDHGLTFHVQPKLRTVLWESCGQPFGPALQAGLCRLERDAALVRQRLRPYLRPREIDQLFVRLDALREAGEFPMLNPRRNIPYGW